MSEVKIAMMVQNSCFIHQNSLKGKVELREILVSAAAIVYAHTQVA